MTIFESNLLSSINYLSYVIKNNLSSYDLLIIAIIIYFLFNLFHFIETIIIDLLSFTKKSKEEFLINLEWYNPTYLLFRKELFHIIHYIKSIKY